MAYTPVAPPQLDWTDPTYNQSIINATQTRDNAITELTRQRGTEAARYGYTPTYNTNGQVQSVAVDPNDPYSKANLLTTSYKEGQVANRNSYAGRGQLYAGSLNAAQGRSTKGYNIGSNSLQQAFIDFIAGNQAAQDTAGSNFDQAVTGAYGDAMSRYVPPVTPEAAAPADPSLVPTDANGNPIKGAGGGALQDTSGFAGLNPNEHYKVASNGRLQIQNSNGTWRYV